MAMPKNKEYDKRIFRLLSILNQLDSGQQVSVRKLAEEFNVSPRSIQRDLEILNRAGFLLACPQKGRHQFAEGFSLKKMKITNEEASLLSFFYDIARSLGKRFASSFSGILKKVIQQEYDSPFYAKIPQAMEIKRDFPVVSVIEKAVEQNRKITLVYEKPKGVRVYKLCPLKLIFYEGFWYLLAQVDRGDWLLKFRLEKIKEAAALDEYFEPPENLKTMLDKSVNVWFSERKAKKALLKVDAGAAGFFRQRGYFPRQKIKKQYKDGALLLEARASDYMEIIPAVLYWIPHVTVIEPEAMRQEIERLVCNYIGKRFSP